MIYNRTRQDVSRALKIRQEKVQKFLPLTDEEVNILERGCLTTITLNRIESAQNEIAEQMVQFGFPLPGEIVTKSWATADLFLADDLKRLIANTEAFRVALNLAKQEEMLQEYNYKTINEIERLLDVASQWVDRLAQSVFYAGDIYSGEV